MSGIYSRTATVAIQSDASPAPGPIQVRALVDSDISVGQRLGVHDDGRLHAHDDGTAFSRARVRVRIFQSGLHQHERRLPLLDYRCWRGRGPDHADACGRVLQLGPGPLFHDLDRERERDPRHGCPDQGWTRTGYSFNTYSMPVAETSPVCRFYIPPELGDSHFYGRGTAECNATAQKNPTFVLARTS